MEENKTELSEAVEDVKEETAREKFEISPLRNSPDSNGMFFTRFRGMSKLQKTILKQLLKSSIFKTEFSTL